MDNHQLIRQSAKDFAETQIKPYFMDWDERQYFPVELMHKMGKLGFLGVLVPHEYGGAGLGYQEKFIVQRYSIGLDLYFSFLKMRVHILLRIQTDLPGLLLFMKAKFQHFHK